MQNLKRIYNKEFKRAVLKSYPFHRSKPIHPYQVFGDFFDASNIGSHLAILKVLYQSATSTKFLKKEPSSIMYDHKLFCELLNAAWVIYKTGVKSTELSFEIRPHTISGGTLGQLTIEKYLMEDERNNPYLGFFHCYKDFSLGTYHKTLYYWFFFALSAKDFLWKDKETKRIYKNLCKIIICSWLIYERELLKKELEEN